MENDPVCAEILSLCADIHRAEYRLLELIAKTRCTAPGATRRCRAVRLAECTLRHRPRQRA
jgi:hypothetical protein